MNWSVGDMVLLWCQCGLGDNNLPADRSLALVAEEALLLEEAGGRLLRDCGVSLRVPRFIVAIA